MVDGRPDGLASPARLMGRARGASDGLLDGWYRLGCELPVLYGLVPTNDTGIVGVIRGRGSVVRGTGSCREVGAIWDEKVVPKVVWVEQGCRCFSWNPGIPKMVAGIIPRSDGSTVVAQLESDLVIGEVIFIPRREGSNNIGGRAGG